MNDLREQVLDVFRQVFDAPDLILGDEMTAYDVTGWDSLTHIDLMIALERRLKIKFAIAEISRTKEPGQNVGSLVQLIDRKLCRDDPMIGIEPPHRAETTDQVDTSWPADSMGPGSVANNW